MSGTDNLKPIQSVEEAREKGRKGGIKSGEVRRKKKMMSQIYSEFLEKKHDVVGKNGQKKRLSGNELLAGVMSKILSRGDSSSVALMREIRQAMEGENINLNGQIVYLDKQDADL